MSDFASVFNTLTDAVETASVCCGLLKHTEQLHGDISIAAQRIQMLGQVYRGQIRDMAKVPS